MTKISAFSRFLDVIAPRRCPVCGCRLSPTEEMICGRCNLRLPRTGYSDDFTDNEMARLFYGKVPVERCAALIFYETRSQANNVIYGLKYHGRLEAGKVMGRIVATEFAPKGFFSGIDMMVPVPLSRGREKERGYNQSVEIAKGISGVCHIPVERKAVCRLSYKGSQTRKGFHERVENVDGAFKLVNSDRVAGKHVLIVDDVVTTGATVSACAHALLGAGNVRISIVSFAFAKS